MSGKKKSGSLRTWRLDRVTTWLMVVALVAALVWSAIATWIWLKREQAHRRQNTEHAEEMAALQDQYQQVLAEAEKMGLELDNNAILMRELNQMFLIFLVDQGERKGREDLLGIYDRMFDRLKGSALSRQQKEVLIATTNKLLGDGTVAAAPRPDPEPEVVEREPRHPEGGGSVDRPVIAGTHVVPPPPPEGLYFNNAYRFSLVFPDSWEVNDRNPAAVLATGERDGPMDRYPPTVQINAIEMKTPRSLEDYARLSLEQIRVSLRGVEELAEGTMRVGGQPAHFVKYRHTRINTAFETIYIVVVHEEFGYVMAFKTTSEKFPRYQKVFNQIYKTVEFK